MPKSRRPRRKPGSRPWRIPPAPLRRSYETVRGVEILAELPGPLGRFLWLLHRDVELWAASPREQRSRLFQPGSLQHPPDHTLVGIVAEPRVLHQMVYGDVPGGGAIACRNIAEWASEAAPITGLYYAWAAAAVVPESGAMAREVAVHAQRVGDAQLAESWTRRAVALARAEGGWSTYARAFTDLGELLTARGEHGRARGAFIRALRACRRHGLPRAIRVRALLGILRLTLVHPTRRDAEQIQHRLLRIYAARHPEGLRTRVAIAQVFVEHGRHGEAIALLNHPTLLRRAAPEDRAAIEEMLALAWARVAESE